jgi:ribonuclease-3
MPSTTSSPSSKRADLHPAAGLVERIGHPFADPALLDQALAHRSWCAEQNNAPSNERLEFLGDAVLGLVVARYVYDAFPELAEGQLAKIRAAVVNTRALAEVAAELQLGDYLLLGRGEESSGGRSKASLLADAAEAVIGAVYLDGGWDVAEALVVRLFGDRIRRAAAEPEHFDHKSRLQELAVSQGAGIPEYVLTGSGPDHERRYFAEVFIGGRRCGRGEGASKKEAEQDAALAALAAGVVDA